MLQAVRKVQGVFPLSDVERVLSLGHPGTGAVLHELETLIKLMGTELMGDVDSSMMKAAAAKKGLPSALGKAMKSGAEAKEMCVIPNKADRAKASYKPSTKAKQQWAEANEIKIAKMVGGKQTDNNKPMDVIVTVGRKTYGIEVKTMVDNGNDKITMHPASRLRKEAWGVEHKSSIQTVVIDDRKAFGSANFSGHQLYFREGVGAFRLKGMTKVRNAAHLRELMGL
ncbi:hypothetical protein UFOVP1196_57 [uncultured Caudovirales phage]|uniref:Uncharacterized protein n=1 Tax=uncultured Caudovirales phage TaxID=2100421 RepID=A0A6J5R747_9CAUD|nr:hypothetical protein UFOVP1196_57 [uncultured Caudovirales phage]